MVDKLKFLKFQKADPKMVIFFDSIAPGPDLGVEKRQMFGYPCRFVRGNMFMGLHNNSMILRLAEKDRDSFYKIGGKPFEPMPGRVMNEYVVVPENILKSEILKTWINKSLSYASGLAPKKKQVKRSK